jgi:hypothetical protein
MRSKLPAWLALLAAGCNGEVSVRFPDLGSAPTAVPFAAGVVSTGNAADELFPSFTPGGDTLYFVRRVSGGRFTIHQTAFQDGAWSDPDVVPFSGTFNDQEPFVSLDGRRLYFTSNRPLTGDEPVAGRTAWVAERSRGQWGAPRRIEAPILLNRPDTVAGFWGQARGPAEDSMGRLWFWGERPEGFGSTDIYVARPHGGGFGDPVNLGPPVNNEHYQTDPELSRDGRFLIFSCDGCPGGVGAADLYVSFYGVDGTWSSPRNLGPRVNSTEYDFSPRVTPDGRYLFFSSNRNVEGEGRGSQNIYYVELAALTPFAEQ